jgi:hypothetical protein
MKYFKNDSVDVHLKPNLERGTTDSEGAKQVDALIGMLL